MLRKVIAGVVAGSVVLAASAAWAAAPQQRPAPGKVTAAQPEGGSDEVPPPAQPTPKKSESFLPFVGLGLLAAAGAGVAIASDDDNPASP